MKFLFSSLLLLQILITNSYAQLWYITRGLANQDERAWGVDVDSAGNIYWAVEEKIRFPNWYYDIVLYKIDINSNQIWQSLPWGGTYNDIAFVSKVNRNDVYLAGRTDTTAALDGSGANALVLCFDAQNGNYKWNYIYDQGFGYEEIDGLKILDDGIYLTGWTKGQSTDMDFLIQKINFSGQRIYTNSWDYNNLKKFDGANGQMAMDDNFIYAAGHVNRLNIASFDGDGVLACFNKNNGTNIWNVTWGGSLYDDALGLAMSSDSMLYVVGYTGSFGKGSQVYLNKYSRNGQLIWNRIWGGNNSEDARAIVADGDSIIFIVGATSSFSKVSGDYEIFILKYNSNGVLIDSLIWGGPYRETAHDVVIFGDYLFITGETNSFGNAQSDGHHAEGLLLKVNGRTMQAPDTNTTNVFTHGYQPIKYHLYQNFPNPFNSSTTIKFDIPQMGYTTLKVYDVFGTTVATLVNDFVEAGTHSITFNTEKLSSGIYFYSINTEKFRKTLPAILIK